MEPDSRHLEDQPEREIELLERLSRTLLHTLRGDLSLLTSELSYLAGICGEGEVGSALSRCRSMAAKLAALEALRVPRVEGGITLDEILKALDASALTKTRDRDVPGSDLPAAFSFLPRCFSSVPRTYSFEHSGTTICFTMQFAIDEDTYPRPRGCTSLSRFLQGRFPDGVVLEGVVADFILRAHGWSVKIHSEAGDVVCAFAGPHPKDCYGTVEAL